MCGEQPNVVVTASWDKSVALWDLRSASGSPVTSVPLPERAYAMDLKWPHALAGTAAPGSVQLLDLRQSPPLSKNAPTRPKITSYPPRCIVLFSRGLYEAGGGYCVGLYEGRVGVYFEPRGDRGSKNWGDDFQFKCHRQKEKERERVYAVNAMTFHPTKPALLVTAGADGEAWLWDVKKRMRVAQLVQASASGLGVSSVSFSRGGEHLAFARSDEWCGGEIQNENLQSAGHTPQVCITQVAMSEEVAR